MLIFLWIFSILFLICSITILILSLLLNDKMECLLFSVVGAISLSYSIMALIAVVGLTFYI
jgi:hypothetical protein